jgi:hypothetical protein
MRIYLAARFDRSAEMRDVAGQLARAGHFVTSRWIYGRQNCPDLVSATEDIEDLTSADCLVSFTEYPVQAAPWAARGGRHVEFGVALAARLRLCIVGPRENIFHHLPKVEVYRTVGELLDGLAGRAEPAP